MSFESTIAGVLDTNVLVYAHLTDAEFHSESSILMNLARKGGQDFAVTPQILMEFYSVMTASRRVSTPYTPEEALTAIERLLTMPGIFVLPYPVDIIDRT
jgi:predicted nucleic acid-binding protein